MWRTPIAGCELLYFFCLSFRISISGTASTIFIPQGNHSSQFHTSPVPHGESTGLPNFGETTSHAPHSFEHSKTIGTTGAKSLKLGDNLGVQDIILSTSGRSVSTPHNSRGCRDRMMLLWLQNGAARWMRYDEMRDLYSNRKLQSAQVRYSIC